MCCVLLCGQQEQETLNTNTIILIFTMFQLVPGPGGEGRMVDPRLGSWS